LYLQDVTDQMSLRYPRLYIPGHLNLFFNKKVFIQSVLKGILSSVVLFFVPYGALRNAVHATDRHVDLTSHQALGFVVSTTLILAVNLQIAFDTSYWTGFNHFVIWGSISFYFGFQFLLYSDFIGAAYTGVARATIGSAITWFTIIVTVVVLMLPIVAYRFFYIDTRPTLSDRVRLKQRYSRLSKSRTSEHALRPSSALRRSRRSLRSGYAFAHQEGFGRLITSGANMRKTESNPTLRRGNAGAAAAGAKSESAIQSQQREAAAAAAAGVAMPKVINDLMSFYVLGISIGEVLVSVLVLTVN
ncbi:PREDICTED: probable phospholipid-transporting ATPase IM, partial [Priapulus caudatus]|uniref:Probable phospholipid-transporting ATPase IM n=1 Tax=Priapulus caudatus TaxID=37621 RepID=A0ABM1EXW7_PRICU